MQCQPCSNEAPAWFTRVRPSARRSAVRLLALSLVVPLFAGCLQVEDDVSAAEKADQAVYAEYAEDRAAATAHFLQQWNASQPDQSQGVDRARWIAVAGIMSHQTQGPTATFKRFLIDNLSHPDPAMAIRAARELKRVTGREVVVALLDTASSPVAEAARRDAAASALNEKIQQQLFSGDDRDVLLDRLGTDCAASPRTPQMVALCKGAEQALSRHAQTKRLDACVGRPIASPAACLREAVAPLPACPPNIEPVASPHGKFPFKAGSEFWAKFIVGFVIDTSGAVHTPHALSTDWRPGPNNKEGPEAYEAAVLAVIARWKYPPRAAPCRHEIPFEVSMGDVGPQPQVE